MSSVNNSIEIALVMVHPNVQLGHRCAVSVAKGVMRTTQATKALMTGCNLNIMCRHDRRVLQIMPAASKPIILFESSQSSRLADGC